MVTIEEERIKELELELALANQKLELIRRAIAPVENTYIRISEATTVLNKIVNVL